VEPAGNPAQAAAEAAAEVARWVAMSPHLSDVLDWHRSLCSVCGPFRPCAEYDEIISEYGAGAYGISVFYPAP
jgi:hypothetical protein